MNLRELTNRVWPDWQSRYWLASDGREITGTNESEDAKVSETLLIEFL